MNKKYKFINKSLFFPKEKLIVFGDLHLGYEEMLKQKGLEVNLNQTKYTFEEIEKAIKYVKAIYGKIEYVIFLGDVKHHFGFLNEEKKNMNELIKIIRKYVENENRIIFIRGNHEKNDKNEKFLDYLIFKDIAFIHGNKEFLEIYDKNINLIVMGHLHPSIVLEDDMKIKREKYKCFLIGKYKKKEFIVVPSFIKFTEGISANEFKDLEEGYDFSIIPEKQLQNFEVFVVQDLGEDALDFGKLKDL